MTRSPLPFDEVKATAVTASACASHALNCLPRWWSHNRTLPFVAPQASVLPGCVGVCAERGFGMTANACTKPRWERRARMQAPDVRAQTCTVVSRAPDNTPPLALSRLGSWTNVVTAPKCCVMAYFCLPHLKSHARIDVSLEADQTTWSWSTHSALTASAWPRSTMVWGRRNRTSQSRTV